jgi:hypothetical protein
MAWWSDNKERFSKIARDYFAIMPTTCSSERSFSGAGLDVTPLRNRLHPQTVRELSCLKSWVNFFSI